MKPPKPLPKISPKKLRALGGKVPFSSITSERKPTSKSGKPTPERVAHFVAQQRGLARKSPVAKANAKRKRKEFARAYGGTDRVVWTKESCACVACGARQQIEVAHTVTGGMGRKANASTTVPLCSWCHADLHRIGKATFERTFAVNLFIAAAEHEQAWQRYSTRSET